MIKAKNLFATQLSAQRQFGRNRRPSHKSLVHILRQSHRIFEVDHYGYHCLQCPVASSLRHRQPELCRSLPKPLLGISPATNEPRQEVSL